MFERGSAGKKNLLKYTQVKEESRKLSRTHVVKFRLGPRRLTCPKEKKKGKAAIRTLAGSVVLPTASGRTTSTLNMPFMPPPGPGRLGNFKFSSY